MAGEKILVVEYDYMLAADLSDIVSRLGDETSGIADSFETANALRHSAQLRSLTLIFATDQPGHGSPNILQPTWRCGRHVERRPKGDGEQPFERHWPHTEACHSVPIKDVLDYLKSDREGGDGLPPAGAWLFA